MTARVAAIWRHPLKSHGREALRSVELRAGETLPWDRAWAVTHAASPLDRAHPGWAPTVHFSRGAKTPGLMAITARLDEATGRLALDHPDLGPLSFCPDDPGDLGAFLDWVRPLTPPDKPQPDAIVGVPGRGMTDTDFPSLSINTLASLAALSEACGSPLARERWRGNLWIAGTEPWAEFDWVGRSLEIGEARLEVRERIRRCLATSADPLTGKRDIDTLGRLNGDFGHQDFGVYAVVSKGGRVQEGDPVTVGD